MATRAPAGALYRQQLMDVSAKGKTILVVEDDANLLDVLRFELMRGLECGRSGSMGSNA